MLAYLIIKDGYHWVEMISTLVEAQTRFDALKAENPEWNLQILQEMNTKLAKKSRRKGWYCWTTKIGE
jgi:hypothetical protein